MRKDIEGYNREKMGDQKGKEIVLTNKAGIETVTEWPSLSDVVPSVLGTICIHFCRN